VSKQQLEERIVDVSAFGIKTVKRLEPQTWSSKQQFMTLKTCLQWAQHTMQQKLDPWQNWQQQKQQERREDTLHWSH
jgi:hypothetical protein